ncbi:MAG: PAS domain-containing protein, partial [Phycisphaerales bacterium]|nr:PAS domain-containing protein [Phycisphaerales bacterium]
MSDTSGHAEVEALRERVRVLERMNEAMMDRIERSVDSAGSAYAMFEANIMMQKAVRERTREAELAAERLKIATDAASVGIWELDVTTGELQWDSTMRALYGLPEDATVSLYEHWRHTVLDEDLPGAESLLQRAIQGIAEFNSRFRIQRPDGQVRHIRAFARGTDLYQGRPRRMIGANYDITDQVERQTELRRTNDTLLHTGRISRTGGWVLERVGEGWVLHWTDVVRRIFEVADDFQPSLESAIDFYAPEARPLIASAVDEAMEHGRPFDLILPFVTATGTPRWGRAMGEAVFNGEHCIRVAGAFQDVTDQHRTRLELEKAICRAEAASAAKSEFLANMSHEIRTPMTAIVGYADILECDAEVREDEDRLRDALRTIRTNATHLLHIINDILDVSKIEAGRLEIERIDSNPIRLVSQVINGLTPLARGKGIDLSMTLDTPIPVSIRTDPTRFTQVVSNLIGNAVKFTEVGSVRVHLAMSSDDERLRV